MKKIAIVALAAAATFITSCDIERMPYDKYTEDKIMEDKDAAVDVLLNGCYAKLKTASEHLHYCGEFPGDNVCKDKPTTNPFGTYFTYQHTVNNGGLSTVWNSAYNIISQTSSLMKMINENESPELNQKLGEAYYMRGMMYFYLCRVFGRPYYQEPEKNLGVPIVNGMPEDMDNLDLPDRSSVKDTYEQVLSDLKKAEELMSDFKSPAYASKYAAQALLAKVYMYMSGTFENPNKEYAQLSYNYANEVIESNQFSLLSRSTFMTYNELAPEAALKRRQIAITGEPVPSPDQSWWNISYDGADVMLHPRDYMFLHEPQVRPLSRGNLQKMYGYLRQGDVAVVGARFLKGGFAIENCGFIYDTQANIYPAFYDAKIYRPTYENLASIPREVSMVDFRYCMIHASLSETRWL